MNNWKTTTAGILSALIGLSGPSSALLAALQAIKASQPGAAQANYTLAIWGAVLTFIFAFLRVWVGLLQNDAQPTPPAAGIHTVSNANAQGANQQTKLLGLMMIAVLLSGTFAASVPLTGCTPAQIENEINTVLQETGAILAVAEPGAAWVAQLDKAAAALKAAEATWTAGGAVQDVINALNTIADITAVIPLTAAYSPLIDILVAGIDSVLELLVPKPVTTAQASGASLLSFAAFAASAARPYNPHKGRAHVKNHKDSKAQWNEYVAAHPELAAALLK